MYQSWGMGNFSMAPQVTVIGSNGLETSTVNANQSVKIKVRTDPAARRVIWQIQRNGEDQFTTPREAGQASGGLLEFYWTFAQAGDYVIQAATPEDPYSWDLFPQGFTYLTVRPSTTTTASTTPITNTTPTTTTNTTTQTTTQPRTPTTPVTTTPPPTVTYTPPPLPPAEDPFITPTNTASQQQQQCPTGYYWDVLRAGGPGCSLQGTVVAPSGPVTAPNISTTYDACGRRSSDYYYGQPCPPPTTTTQPPATYTPPGGVIYQPVQTGAPQAPATQPPAINTGAISDFFSSSVNILGVEVPLIALVGVLWFLK